MEEQQTDKGIDRRNFIRVAGAGLTAAGVALTPAERALAQFKTDRDRLDRLASCTWPIRSIFKTARGAGGAAVVLAVVARRRPLRHPRPHPLRRLARLKRQGQRPARAAAETPRPSFSVLQPMADGRPNK
jgi:hypothetical protein